MMPQTVSRFVNWRPGVWGAAMHFFRNILLEFCTLVLSLVCVEELTATTFVAVLNIASFSGAGLVTGVAIAVMAACFVNLAQVRRL